MADLDLLDQQYRRREQARQRNKIEERKLRHVIECKNGMRAMHEYRLEMVTREQRKLELELERIQEGLKSRRTRAGRPSGGGMHRSLAPDIHTSSNPTSARKSYHSKSKHEATSIDRSKNRFKPASGNEPIERPLDGRRCSRKLHNSDDEEDDESDDDDDDDYAYDDEDENDSDDGDKNGVPDPAILKAIMAAMTDMWERTVVGGTSPSGAVAAEQAMRGHMGHVTGRGRPMLLSTPRAPPRKPGALPGVGQELKANKTSNSHAVFAGERMSKHSIASEKKKRMWYATSGQREDVHNRLSNSAVPFPGKVTAGFATHVASSNKATGASPRETRANVIYEGSPIDPELARFNNSSKIAEGRGSKGKKSEGESHNNSSPSRLHRIGAVGSDRLDPVTSSRSDAIANRNVANRKGTKAMTRTEISSTFLKTGEQSEGQKGVSLTARLSDNDKRRLDLFEGQQSSRSDRTHRHVLTASQDVASPCSFSHAAERKIHSRSGSNSHHYNPATPTGKRHPKPGWKTPPRSGVREHSPALSSASRDPTPPINPSPTSSRNPRDLSKPETGKGKYVPAGVANSEASGNISKLGEDCHESVTPLLPPLNLHTSSSSAQQQQQRQQRDENVLSPDGILYHKTKLHIYHHGDKSSPRGQPSETARTESTTTTTTTTRTAKKMKNHPDNKGYGSASRHARSSSPGADDVSGADNSLPPIAVFTKARSIVPSSGATNNKVNARTKPSERTRNSALDGIPKTSTEPGRNETKRGRRFSRNTELLDSLNKPTSHSAAVPE